MPDVIEQIIADAPPKVPVDVVAHEADLNDFETYKAAKKGDWKPPVKETEKPVAEVKTETPAETKEAKEGETPSTEAKAEADSESGTEQTETTQEKPAEGGKRKQTAAERISELSNERNFVRQENAKLKAKIEELEKLPQAAPIPDTGEPKKPTRPKTPSPLDPRFTTTTEYNVAHEQYEKDLDKYETDLDAFNSFTRSKTQREEAVKQQAVAVRQRFQATVADAIEKNRFGDDFKPFAGVQDGGPPVSTLMAEILPRLEDPPAVLNYLQRNPKFAESLHDIKDSTLVVYQLARLEGILIGTERAAKAAAKTEPADTKPPEKPVTPKPVTKPPVTLTGSGETPVRKLDEANEFEEYRRLKAAGARL